MVLQLGAGHLGEFGKVGYSLSHSQCALPTQFRVFRAFPWPRRGPCGTPTWSWSPWRGWASWSFAFSWQICHTYQISGLYGLTMAQKRPLWYSNLVLVTLDRLGNLVIVHLVANLPYLPNFRSLGPYHGPEEAPVVLQLGPGHLG